MKRLRKHLPRRELQLERLEDRLALAGNVNATIVSGSLVITGDDLENQIQIVSLAPADATKFRVTGLNDTRINTPDPNDPNPLSEVVFDVAALTKDVRIDMKGALNGNVAVGDRVFIDGLEIAGKLDVKGKNGGELSVAATSVAKTTTVKFGNGHVDVGSDLGSFVDFVSSELAGNVSITTGIHNDLIGLSVGTTVGGNLTIKSNAGNDEIPISGNYVPGLNILFDSPTIRGNLDIQTKDGDDIVIVEGHKVNGKTTIKAGQGENTVGLFHNVLGIATDFTKSSKEKCNDVLITTESKVAGTQDLILVEDNILARHLTISTKSGNDNIDVRNTFVGFHCTGNLKITTADGNDSVVLDGHAFDSDTIMDDTPEENIGNGNHVTGTTTIDTGKGDDDVRVGLSDLVGKNRFEGKAAIKLGDGENTLALIGVLTGTEANDFDSTTKFEKDLTVSTGKGADGILTFGVLMEGNHSVSDTGGGLVIANNNTAILGNLSVKSGAGADVLAIGNLGVAGAQNFVGGTTTVKTGAGNDLVSVAAARLEGKVSADLSKDRDQLLIANTALNINTAVVKAGSAAEDNRGVVNGQDLGALGVPGFVAGGVDANFAAQVDAAIEAHFADLIDEILAALP